MWALLFAAIAIAFAGLSGFLGRRLIVGNGRVSKLVAEETRLTAEIEQLRPLAVIEPKTGLLNERGFEQRILPLVSQALRQGGQQVCTLMADLNDLKKVNDVYGHDAGDAYLRAFVDSARRCFVREADIVARIGGDEFAIAFPCRDAKDAADAMRRLYEDASAQTIHALGKTIPLRLAIGGSVLTVRPSVKTDPAVQRLERLPSHPVMTEIIKRGVAPLVVDGGQNFDTRFSFGGATGLRALVKKHQALADEFMYTAKRSAKEEGKPIVILDGVII